MKPDTFHFQLLLASFAGWVNREQSQIIDYLREENRVLKAVEQCNWKGSHPHAKHPSVSGISCSVLDMNQFVVERIAEIGKDPMLQRETVKAAERDQTERMSEVAAEIRKLKGYQRRLGRVAKLLIEKITYNTKEEEVAITFRPEGVKQLGQQRGQES